MQFEGILFVYVTNQIDREWTDMTVLQRRKATVSQERTGAGYVTKQRRKIQTFIFMMTQTNDVWNI